MARLAFPGVVSEDEGMMLGNPLVRYRASLQPLEVWRLSEPGTFQDDVLVWSGQGLLDDEAMTDAPTSYMDIETRSAGFGAWAYVPPSAAKNARDLLGLTLQSTDGRSYLVEAVEDGWHFRKGVRVFWRLTLNPQSRTGHGENLGGVL